MSEQGQTVGQVLRDARAAQGVTLENAAIRLHLMQRQIEAMESDDFGSLGQPVFARGFVRNYARLLGLAPEPLLARMGGAPAEPAVVAHPAALAPHSWLTSPWVILLMLGVLLAVAVPVALYWWLNSGADETTAQPAPRSRPLPVPAVPVAPVPVAPPVPAATAPSLVQPASPAAPAVPETPVTPLTPVTPEQAPAMPDEAGAPAAPQNPAASGALHLEFGADAWVEIKDAGGQMLLRKQNPAGSRVDLQGRPPFDMVVGNAAQTKMTYNGRPIDLTPYIDATVARFTLE
jgi:cytoskeleton protein RodZ